MTLMVIAACAGVLAGVALGGRPARIAHLRLRRWWLVVFALVGQAVVGLLPAGLRALVIVVASAALVAWCAANAASRRLFAGMVLLGAGLLANMAVIAANGGMPVAPAALRAIGVSGRLEVSRGFLFKHVRMAGHGRLAVLADRIPVPGLRTVLSAGDIVMLVGIFLVLLVATEPRRLLFKGAVDPVVAST